MNLELERLYLHSIIHLLKYCDLYEFISAITVPSEDSGNQSQLSPLSHTSLEFEMNQYVFY